MLWRKITQNVTNLPQKPEDRSNDILFYSSFHSLSQSLLDCPSTVRKEPSFIIPAPCLQGAINLTVRPCHLFLGDCEGQFFFPSPKYYQRISPVLVSLFPSFSLPRTQLHNCFMPIVNSSMFFEKLSGVWKLSVFLILFSMLHVYLKNLRRVFEGKKRKSKAEIYTVGACSVQKNVKISSGWHSAQFSWYLNRSYSLKASHQRHSKKHLFGFKNNRSFRISCQLFTHRSEVKSFPCSVLPDNLNHQGSTHGWLFRTPHTEMPPFPCAAEVWGHPGRRAACIPNMPHRNSFLGPSTALMPMIRYLYKKIREYKHSPHNMTLIMWFT